MSLLRRTFSFSALIPESSQSWSQNTSSNPEDGVRRVTIKQLLTVHETHQGSFCIGQRPLEKFILVANVYKNQVILSKSRIFYGFDDGSGRISGYKTNTGTNFQTFVPFAYATILGHLVRYPDGSLAVKVSYILPVIDPHEIYYHILHVIFDELRYEKGNPTRGDWLTNETYDPDLEGLTQALDDMDISNSPLSELEKDIIDCIGNLKEYWEAHDDIENFDRGIQIGALVHEVAPHHQEKVATDFLIAVERLLARGLLRTTIDDNHLDLQLQ